MAETSPNAGADTSLSVLPSGEPGLFVAVMDPEPRCDDEPPGSLRESDLQHIAVDPISQQDLIARFPRPTTGPFSERSQEDRYRLCAKCTRWFDAHVPSTCIPSVRSRPSAQVQLCAGGAAPAQHAAPRKPHAVATGLQGLLGGYADRNRSVGRRSSFPSRGGGSVPATPTATASAAFIAFKKQRLFDLAAHGEELPKNGAWKEWIGLSEEERERFKRNVQERRRLENEIALEEAQSDERQSAAAGLLERLRGEEEEESLTPTVQRASAAGTMLHKLQEQASRKPTVAEVRARLRADREPRKRKGTQKEAMQEAMHAIEERARNIFPRRQEAPTVCADRAARRQEIAGLVKTRAEGSKAAVSITSSHGVSLSDLSARASAPTLSCDWERRDSDSEEPDLEVDMPGQCQAKQLMHDQMQRKISSRLLLSLAKKSESSKAPLL